MIAVKSMDLRDNFKNYCDRVVSGETVFVARKDNENVVIISEKEYNEMLKAKQNAEYLSKLDSSISELNQRKTITLTLDEMEAMETMSEEEAKAHVARIREKQGQKA